LTDSNSVPIFGFTKPIVKKTIEKQKTINFKKGLKLDLLGLKNSNICSDANFF
jgi:hypothetical protein